MSIHRWTENTLRALLAGHLYPDKQALEGELPDLRLARQSADKKTARKLKIKPKAKRAVTVGTLTQTIAAGDSTVTVKLTKKARKAFKRARKVKLLITMTMTDAAGNATTRSITVTLKR